MATILISARHRNIYAHWYIVSKCVYPLLAARFGRITNEGFEFEELTGNTFFYEPQTLVCGSDGSPAIWRYSQNSDQLDPELLQESDNHVNFSWLEVNNTKQGYYYCQAGDSMSYTVGLYDVGLTKGENCLTICETFVILEKHLTGLE